MSKNNLLDAHALLTFFQMEKGFEVVKRLLHQANREKRKILLSLMSYGEFCCIVERKKGLEFLNRSLAVLEGLPIQFTEITKTIIEQAAHYKAHFPVSLADAICAATAKELNLSVVTADPDFKFVEQEISILWTR